MSIERSSAESTTEGRVPPGGDWPSRSLHGAVGAVQRLRWLLCLLLFYFSLAHTSVYGEVRFTASLDRDSVVLGEAVTLTLKFEGGGPSSMPALPRLPGFLVAPGVSSSINSSMGPDGTMTSVQSYAVTLVPQQVGMLAIPALVADVDGKRLQSSPLSLRVLRSDPGAPPAEFADKLAFLWLVPPQKEIYVGQPLILEMRLYLRGEVRNISDVQLPALGSDGFTSSKLDEGQQFQRRVGNTPFVVIPIKLAITPVKIGSFTLGKTPGSMVAHVVAGRDPFGFDIFGPRTQPRQVELAIEPQELVVKPLPTEHVPPDFNGAVGNYTMSVTAGPTNVAVGDPITVRVQIAGEGPLESLTLPEQSAWKSFKTYPPTTKVELQDKLGLHGTKTFEQIVVPQTAEIKELPPVSFSFFDVYQKTYRTLTQPGVPLLVRTASSAVVPTVLAAGRPEAPPPAQDIVPIKQRIGLAAKMVPPLLQQPWFQVLQGLPLLGWLAAFAWRKRTDTLANNPRLRRRRHVAQIVRDGLGDLRRLAQENRSDEFFAVLSRLFQEQLGERLDVPASAITDAVVDERLRPRGVSENVLESLRELFQICNVARYAPVKTSQELAALIPRAESLLQQLQALKL